MSADARILVVDDERSMREFLEILLRREGFAVDTAADVEAALVGISADDYDLIITDIQMPGKTGLDLLRAVREQCPETMVVMITAFASTETAIAAMKEGAYDYITKPFQVDAILLTIRKALEKRLLASENVRLRQELRRQVQNRRLVGNSAAMRAVYELVAQVAATKTNVLVSGESGTGKELVARAIHESSDRKDQPLVTVNCGAIPEALLESELFGHLKGAFTGAVQNKQGLFELADSGTLFLDEVGELSPALQVKLLRATQEKTIRRVGDTQDRRVDVRILSATNRRLEEEVAAGRFREDLYYRLNVIELRIPPLRERSEDIPLLTLHFLDRYSREFEKELSGLSAEAMERLTQYAFPGNVRELENIIERAVALATGERVEVDALPHTVRPAETAAPPTNRIPEDGVRLEALVDDYERGLLKEALERSGGVKKRAAHLLGISFRSFRYRLEKLGLESPAED